MGESRIFLKEHLLKNIPATLASRALRILFAESGLMPTSKGKKKKCFIVIYVSGIAFFRPHLNHWKITLFISSYEILEIRRIDSANTREIVMKSRTVAFSCPHADIAASFLMGAREALWMGCQPPLGFKLTNYPDLIQKENLSTVRYISLCTRYSVQGDDRIIDFLKAMDKITNKTLVIGEDFGGCEHLKCLIVPIVRSEKFCEVHFRSTMPYAVCRMAHFMLKSSGRIRDVIFEGYQSIVPSQLRMETLKISSSDPISLTFRNCSFGRAVFIKLVDELSQFKGEYRKLVFHGLQLSAKMLKHLLNVIRHGRCFRALQTLAFDGFYCRAIFKEKIHKNFREVMKRLHFLKRISISNWPSPVNFNLSIFQYTDLLSELVLRKQDMGYIFDSFYLPPRVHLLDFSGCHFTFSSLMSLFECLAGRESRLSLILQDLVVPEAHWLSFFDLLPSLPTLSCLSELDWSGNFLARSVLPVFAGYFFNRNRIRFLGFNRIFRSLSLPALAELFKLIPSGVLYGLSLEGSVHANFSGCFHGLTEVLDLLGNISLLYLDGQRMTDSDAGSLLAYLARHPPQELSCDCTALSKETFFSLYQRLVFLDIPAIGRPYSDISRLFGSSPTHPSFAAFRTQILPRLPVTPVSARSAFSSSDAPSLHLFALTHACDRDPDPFGLVAPPASGPARSIARGSSIAELHGAENPDPHAVPSYPLDARDDKEPERGLEDADAQGSDDETDIYIEPLWHSPEVHAAVRFLGGIEDVEEEELPEIEITARQGAGLARPAFRASLAVRKPGQLDTRPDSLLRGRVGSIPRSPAVARVEPAREPSSILVPGGEGTVVPDLTTARSSHHIATEAIKGAPSRPVSAPPEQAGPGAAPPSPASRESALAPAAVAPPLVVDPPVAEPDASPVSFELFKLPRIQAPLGILVAVSGVDHPAVTAPQTPPVAAPRFTPPAVTAPLTPAFAARSEPPVAVSVVKAPAIVASPVPAVIAPAIHAPAVAAPPGSPVVKASAVIPPPVLAVAAPPRPPVTASVVKPPLFAIPPVPAAIAPLVKALPVAPPGPPVSTHVLTLATVTAPSVPAVATRVISPPVKAPTAPPVAAPTVVVHRIAVSTPPVTAPPPPRAAAAPTEPPTVAMPLALPVATPPPATPSAPPVIGSVPPSIHPPGRPGALAPAISAKAPSPAPAAPAVSFPTPMDASAQRRDGAAVAVPARRAAALAAVPLSPLTAVTVVPSAGPPPTKVVPRRRPPDIAEVPRPSPRQNAARPPSAAAPSGASVPPPGAALSRASSVGGPSAPSGLSLPSGLPVPRDLSRPLGGFIPLGRPGFATTMFLPQVAPSQKS
jgi:hypothetical protein